MSVLKADKHHHHHPRPPFPPPRKTPNQTQKYNVSRECIETQNNCWVWPYDSITGFVAFGFANLKGNLKSSMPRRHLYL